MRIEIWSDVVCPWCYIGKRRLETALSGFDHADEVEVVWRSFELDPSAPVDGSERAVVSIARKYGRTVPEMEQMMEQVAGVAAEEGLAYRLGETLHVNTVDAHRVIHLALAEGGTALQGQVKEALLAAYFTHARNVADHAVLRDVAVLAGLPADRVEAVLAGEEYAEAVRADVEQARRYGATGVPFFVVDGRYGVSGAQPAEAFSQVLARAWEDAHPALTMVSPDGIAAAGGTADACGPDGCPV